MSQSIATLSFKYTMSSLTKYWVATSQRQILSNIYFSEIKVVYGYTSLCKRRWKKKFDSDLQSVKNASNSGRPTAKEN